MTWLWKWWKRRADGTEARQAAQRADQQAADAGELAEAIQAAGRRVDQAKRRTDFLAREVTKALGARG